MEEIKIDIISPMPKSSIIVFHNYLKDLGQNQDLRSKSSKQVKLISTYKYFLHAKNIIQKRTTLIMKDYINIPFPT